MATRFATQQQGVADGTLNPPAKADGRQVNARRHAIIASKEAGVAWNSGDVVYLGKKPNGSKVIDLKVDTDTSFGSATIDIGVGGDPKLGGTVVTAGKYCTGVTNTVVNKMVSIGPLASTLDDTPPGEEHLWATIGAANIAAGTLASIVIELAGQ